MTAEPPPRAFALAAAITDLGCSWCGHAEALVEPTPGGAWQVVAIHLPSCPIINAMDFASPAEDVARWERAAGIALASYAATPEVWHRRRPQNCQ